MTKKICLDKEYKEIEQMISMSKGCIKDLSEQNCMILYKKHNEE